MMIRILRPERSDIDKILEMPSAVALLELGNLDDAWKVVKGSNEIIAGYVDETLVCLVGVIPASILADSATVWLLATEHIGKHSFLFFRYGRIWLKTIRDKYHNIYCVCHHNTKLGDRWLTILGFSCISAAETYNIYKLRRY